MSSTQFANKVVIVTGAASGIGLASAKLLSERGAKVMLVDRDQQALEANISSLNNDRCQMAVADVTQVDQVAEYVEKTRQSFGGQIDCFFHNAGIEGETHSLLDYPLAAYDNIMDVNAKAALIGLQKVVPHMREGGSIVMSASVASEYGSPGLVGYHASKHALVGIMRTAAVEFSALGIRINTINPGAVNTKMFERITENSGYSAEQYAAAIKAGVPLGRYAQAEEVAEVALFLLSDAASYCQGRMFGVDGGISVSCT